MINPKPWLDNCKTQSKRINHKVDEENGKALGKVNVRYQKFVGFSAMNFGRTLVVLFKLLHLVLGVRGCGRRKRRKR